MSIASGVSVSIQVPERRWRIYHLREDFVANMLRYGRDLPDAIHMARFVGPPADAEIVSIHYAYEWRAFAFTMSHPSFEPVAPGAMIREGDADMATLDFRELRFVRGEHHSFAGLNRDELLRIRDDLNAALYDLDKRPMG